MKESKMTDIKDYTTSDFYVTAMLISQKFTVENVDGSNPKRKVFTFKDSKELREAIKNYMNGTLVGNLREFKNAIESTKDYLHN
jgi:transcriptional regulator with AAA-type ATPase domain